MRIWSIHPSYLDWKGLGALWRETLLAQAVLLGKTKGWRNHPQLDRFKHHPEPVKAVGYFLREVHIEATNRNYNYNFSKILEPAEQVELVSITEGQLRYELEILMERLQKRTPKKFKENLKIEQVIPRPHPLFRVVEGQPELWEKSYWNNPRS
jgi:hypothetical protein